jgi:hypothetical protein
MLLNIETIDSDKVWLFKCDNCGWHSDVCHYPATQCLNCGNDVNTLQVFIGTSEEIGNYLKYMFTKRNTR